MVQVSVGGAVWWFPLNKLSSGFMEDNPTGQLSKEKMLDMYNTVLSLGQATKFVEDIFQQFDKDQNGEIDFKVIINLLPGEKG